MKVTESRYKNRQLHIEDYLQMVSAEQKEYAEVSAHQRITENNDIITDFQTDNLLEQILHKDNLNKAYKKVKSNKGAGGVDGMSVDELLGFLKDNQEQLIQQIKDGKYKPNPVRRVEIPKETKGEVRKLGVPTVVDRVFQQAITQVLTPIYEKQFSEDSFGFRPNRGAHDALKQCQTNVNDGYVYVVDMDLEKFFDTVCQSKLIEVLSRTIKDGRVISLIHKYLNAGVISRGMFEKTEVGMPQGGPLSPPLSNIMLNELDKELTCRGHRFVRYADDFLIGVNGSKEDCVQIKRQLSEFIARTLKMELSEEKTLITHSNESARFLGYDVRVRRDQTVKPWKNCKQRTLNNTVELLIPLKDKIEKYLFSHGVVRQREDNGKLEPVARVALTRNTDLEIVTTYDAELRGLCNYYFLASNYRSLNYFSYLMEYSCLKTLAWKHRCKLSKIYNKYRTGAKRWGIPYETKKGKKIRYLTKFNEIDGKKCELEVGLSVDQYGDL